MRGNPDFRAPRNGARRENLDVIPSKLPIRMGYLDLSLNTWFLATRVNISNGITITSAAFDRDRQTAKQTDRQTTLLRL